MLIILLLLRISVVTSEGNPSQFCFEGCILENQVVTCNILLEKDLEKLSKCIGKHSGVLIIDIRHHELKCNCAFLEFCTAVQTKPQTIIFHDDICDTNEITNCGKIPQSASLSGEEPVFALISGIVFDIRGEDFEPRLTQMYADHKKIISSLTNPSTKEKYLLVEEEMVENAVLSLVYVMDNPEQEADQDEVPIEEPGNAKGLLGSDEGLPGLDEEPEGEDDEEDSEDYELPEEDKDELQILFIIIVACHFVLIVVVIIILFWKLVMKKRDNRFFKRFYNRNTSALRRKKKKKVIDLEGGIEQFLSKNDNQSNKRPKDPGKKGEILNSEEAVPLLLNEQSESEAETSHPTAYDRNDLERGQNDRSDVALDLSSVPDEVKENWVNWLSQKRFLQHIYNKNTSALGRRRKERIIDLKNVPFLNQHDSKSDDQYKDPGKNLDIINNEDVTVSNELYNSETGVYPKKDFILDSSQIPFESMVNEVLNRLPGDDPLIISIQKLYDDVQMFKKDLQEKNILPNDTEPEQICDNHDVKIPDTLFKKEFKDPVESCKIDKEIFQINEVTLDLSKVPNEVMGNEVLNQCPDNDPLIINIQKLYSKVQMFKKDLEETHLLEMDIGERKERENITRIHAVKNSSNLMGVSKKSSSEQNKRQRQISERSHKKVHRVKHQEEQVIKKSQNTSHRKSQKRIERDVKILPEKSSHRLKYQEKDVMKSQNMSQRRSRKRIEQDVKVLPEKCSHRLKYPDKQDVMKSQNMSLTRSQRKEEGIIYTSPKISHRRVRMKEETIVHMSPKISCKRLRKRKELDAQKLQEISNRKSLMREKGIIMSPETSLRKLRKKEVRDVRKSPKKLHKRSNKRAERFIIISPILSCSSAKPEECIIKMSPKISLSSLRKREDEILRMSHSGKKCKNHRSKRHKQRDVSSDTDTD